MSDFDENPFEDLDDSSFDDFEEEGFTSEETGKNTVSKSRNRNFIIALGVLGGVFIIAVIILVIAATVILPRTREARMQEAAEINAQNTATSIAATNYAIAQAQAALPTDTPVPTNTLEPSPTPVVVFDTQTPSPTVDLTATSEKGIGGPALEDADRTATISALLTQAASGGTALASSATPTPTSLSDTGFADDLGLPLLFGSAILLVFVIFFVRRLRFSDGR